eukprot:1065109-Pyramimonas_sp.AAC.1
MISKPTQQYSARSVIEWLSARCLYTAESGTSGALSDHVDVAETSVDVQPEHAIATLPPDILPSFVRAITNEGWKFYSRA